VGDLLDAERDALRAVQALAALNRHLTGRGTQAASDDQVLRDLAEEGCAAAGRILAYLRQVRGSGDGVALVYPARLGPWRDWCPPRGSLLGRPDGITYRPHSGGDPGE
jgi:hypothetical protein